MQPRGSQVDVDRRSRVVLADGRRPVEEQREPTRQALLRFGLGTALALAVLVVSAVLLAGRAAQEEGITDARRTTELVAHTVIEPNLTPALLRGDPAATVALDGVVRQHVLRGAHIQRLKVWDEQGRVIYSDEPRLVGRVYPLPPDDLRALRTSGVRAELSELEGAENEFERELAPRLLETYLGVRSTDGQPMLFEAYYSYDVVAARRRALLLSFSSITLLGLVVFAAVQLYLGRNVLRWLQSERERLLEEAAAASRHERLRIASDVHDGTLQDLVGASYVVSGAVSPVRRMGGEDVAQGLRSAADSIRTGVQSLRSMIVDLYPETLRSAGLRAALSDLAASLRARGITVDIDVPDDLGLRQDLEEAVYRAAQEALRNIATHARARSVRVHVALEPGEVVLVVQDDGRGFDLQAPAPQGHLGLRALADRTAARGGVLEVLSGPDCGTELRLRLPA